MDKMHGLSIREQAYAILYTHCAHCFPNVARSLSKPEMHQTLEMHQAYAFQAPVAPVSIPRQSWTDWAVSAPTAPPAIPSNLSYYNTRPMNCIFCSQLNHLVKNCPIALEYVRSGRAVYINRRIHLPNGLPIPDDIPGSNLQARIDNWAATQAASGTASTFTHKAPPHAVHSLKVMKSYGLPVRQAHIVEVLDSDSIGEEEEDNDIFEVYTTERRK